MSPKQDLIVSAIYTDRKEDLIDPPNRQGNPTVTNVTRDLGYQAEGQYLLREDWFNVTAGAGTYRFDVAMEEDRDYGGGTCKKGINCSILSPGVTRKRDNAYMYVNFNLPKNITATLGLSYDFFKYDIDREDFSRLHINPAPGDDKSFRFSQFSPKVGLQWDIVRDVRLRFAWFETVKPSLVANQSLEPTQVAGFNQLFDDVNGTRARRIGVGLDARIANKLYGGFETSARNLDVPFLRSYLSLSSLVKQKEQLYRTYLYWVPHPHWAVRGEFQFEKYMQDPADAGTNPYRMETLSAPVNLNYFNPSGIFATVTTTYVQQEVLRSSSSNSGVDDFVILDTTIGYRLPNRRGIISLKAEIF